MRAELESIRNTLPATAAFDPGALTATLSSAQIQEYISHASQSALAPIVQRQSRAWRRWLGGVAMVALAVLALLLVPSVRNRLGGSLLAPGEEHIAVLPFDNIGNDPANEPLAQGLTDSLAGRLSNLDVGGKSLWVVPSSEVRKRKISDPSAALHQWGATVVVEGSIARDGQDVHLTVNLIDTKNLRQIGSASLEDRAGDLAALQDQAVSELAKLMHINVTADVYKRQVAARTS